ncbi:MAG: hypothetical protein K8R90_02255 [Candidatus Cloacimonetes bacterium]|nr:hypothetical protein [Candidatus Cloacimonadota bacterium]
MRKEWWVLLFSLVALSLGYILIQVGETIQFHFLRGFIMPAILILLGDFLGEYIGQLSPFLSRLMMGRGSSHPGLFLKLLGWVMLYGYFVLALVRRLVN